MAAREQRQTWVDITLAKNTDSQRKAVSLAMQTCYWVITQEAANCKASLDNALDLNCGANSILFHNDL